MIAGIVAGFIILIVVFYFILSAIMRDDTDTSSTSQSASNSSSTKNSNNGGSGGQSLQGDIKTLIGSVSSNRNVQGLTLRINQIDTCSLPNADAYVAVTNADGKVIEDLKKGEVTVTVDGKKVDSFSFDPVGDNQRPLSSTLVIDKSGSMVGAPIVDARNAAKTYVDSSGKSDTIALVSFDNQVQTLQTLTADKPAVKGAIDGIQAKGNTAIYDALSVAIDNTTGCGRKAIVLMSDGDDTASSNFNLESVINKANLAGLPVFTVGLKGEDFNAATLRAIADRTGGQYYETSNSADLATLYSKISNQLKGQYYVGLKLNIPKTGEQHSLKITSKVSGSPTTSERFFIY